MKDLILGAHLLIARAGTVIDGVTVGPEAKPDTTPSTNWTAAGHCEQFEPQRSGTKIERWSPNPGVFTLRETFMTSNKLAMNFGLQEWDQMMFAELLLGGQTPVSGVFQPNSNGKPVEAWLKIQCYDQDNLPTLYMDLYCSLTIASYQFKNGLEPYTLVAEVLYSTLNTGLIQNLN
jgi:hypothetical protein